jgi:hypothetical protein
MNLDQGLSNLVRSITSFKRSTDQRGIIHLQIMVDSATGARPSCPSWVPSEVSTFPADWAIQATSVANHRLYAEVAMPELPTIAHVFAGYRAGESSPLPCGMGLHNYG